LIIISLSGKEGNKFLFFIKKLLLLENDFGKKGTHFFLVHKESAEVEIFYHFFLNIFHFLPHFKKSQK